MEIVNKLLSVQYFRIFDYGEHGIKRVKSWRSKWGS